MTAGWGAGEDAGPPAGDHRTAEAAVPPGRDAAAEPGEAAGVVPAAVPSRSGRRRVWAMRALKALGVVVLAPFVLTLVYWVVPPVSTLMLARWVTFQPVTRDWVSFDEIAPAAVRAVVVSEDARLCLHYGVDTVEFDKVVDAYMDGRRTRGASTIPMQVAKNLFLWPGRDVIRKGLEIPLALWIDLVLPKRRIVEIYMNIAEWGPDGEFGIQAGAERAFGKDAAKLTARQGALMAAVLPNPIRRDAGKPSRTVSSRAATVASLAARSGGTLGCLFPDG
ncbi:monofunctional biosynthetic peptidoglycan transglycosylase [Pseudoxanthobacter soli DSM 19599]|uniref:Biosynthetic peptidoglycan transglycosylase n=1 Tax=Pseudoxanthobacter soli DSM 19599 TaxID=1123029 RepID=A0A1M7ZFB6_9HYPH|nr:transglycosylase domain-containing protein [Pseudoxanthobacter soli]SHO63611.1 monofunctional biosynthetic peptidoglycan transglycosylase [Pseudoxanthobacter soli DSM 19599]